MRIKILLLATLLFATTNVLAVGISFKGVTCLTEDDRGDLRFIPSIDVFSTSKIIVTGSNASQNIFFVEISGGIPRMDANGRFACMEKTIPFGHSSADPETITDNNNIVTPVPNDSIGGVAWWNNDDLIVTFSALYFAEEPRIEPIVQSSMIFPTSHTMIFNYDENNHDFKLVELIGSVGQVSNISANINDPLSAEPPFYFDRLTEHLFITKKPTNVFYTLFE